MCVDSERNIFYKLGTLVKHFEKYFGHFEICWNIANTIKTKTKAVKVVVLLCYTFKVYKYTNATRKEHNINEPALAYRAVGRGGGARGAHAPPPPPKSQKGPPDGIIKDLEWYKTNVVVLGFTIWMHFQQFEDLKFLIFSAEHDPGPP